MKNRKLFIKIITQLKILNHIYILAEEKLSYYLIFLDTLTRDVQNQNKVTHIFILVLINAKKSPLGTRLITTTISYSKDPEYKY